MHVKIEVASRKIEGFGDRRKSNVVINSGQDAPAALSSAGSLGDRVEIITHLRLHSCSRAGPVETTRPERRLSELR